VLAVNKMDLVDYSQEIFDTIANEYRALAATLGIEHVQAIPLSALRGDNLTARSSAMPWYMPARPLLEHLETVALDAASADGVSPAGAMGQPAEPEFPRLCRHADRGGRGQAKGDDVIALPSARRSRIAQVFGPDGEIERAVPGQAITLTLADELDVSRGDVLAAAAARRRSPTSSPRICCGWATPRWCPDGRICSSSAARR
jgi:bifunctional enzyme CysN/CysC